MFQRRLSSVAEHSDTAASDSAPDEGLFLAAVLDSSDDAIFGIDESGVVTRWNRGARRLYGYEVADVLGKPAGTLFAAHCRHEGEALVQRALHGEHVERAESDARRRDGLVVPVWISLTPLARTAGSPATVAAVVRDVSEQKLAAATLAESEERLRESEVLAHTGAWLWDGDDVVQWSDGMYSIHGVSPREFDATLDAHFAFLPDDDRRGAEAQLLDAFRAARTFETEYQV